MCVGVYDNIMQRNSKEIIKRLLKEGWELVRVKGGHHIFKHRNYDDLITVSHPNKDMPVGTVHQIYKIAGWNKYPDRGMH